MSRILPRAFLLAWLWIWPAGFCQAAEKNLETRFVTVRYDEDREIAHFLWRISGKHITLVESAERVKNRVDELVTRVQEILEMYPDNFHFSIEFTKGRENAPVAQYAHRNRTVTVALDRVTDGVLAHEIAHAVISDYFPVPPPERAQEILAQYVDKHLYEDPLPAVLK